MNLIVKTADGFAEIDHVVGHGLVGTAIESVHFTFRDCDNTELLLRDLKESILPRMRRPVEADFLPNGPRQMPVWATFVRGTAAEAIELAAQLERKGVSCYRFTNNAITVNTVNTEGQYLDCKMISVYDETGLNLGGFFLKLDLSENRDISRFIERSEDLARKIGRADWQGLTGADIAAYYARTSAL